MRSRSRPNSRQRPSCSLSPHQRNRAAEGVRPPLPDILRRALPSSLLDFQAILMWRLEGTTGAGRSDCRGHLQAHAWVDLIPREIVGLADGLYLRPRIFPDCSVLYCYPPERISWRNGVVHGLRLSPCHAARVHSYGESCGNEQGPEPATTIFRAVPSHRENIRDDFSFPTVFSGRHREPAVR
jgi:hypothetical protein